MKQQLPIIREGDRVKLRGRSPIGVLRALRFPPQRDAQVPTWADVEWDADVRGPKICHLHELEKI
jgi:hypothetical protein